MNRRRGIHWWNRLTIGTAEVVGVVWTNIVYVVTLPYYSLLGLWYRSQQRAPRRASTGGKFAAIADALMMIPQWTWYYFTLLVVSAWYGILQWPRVMRLRDLAAGLPALAAAVGAFVVLFVLNKDDVEVVNTYYAAQQQSSKQADAATDEAGRAKALEDLLFYSRALAKIQPTNQYFRMETARTYWKMGKPDRAGSILNSLASEGYADAQFTLAELQMDVLNSDTDYLNAEKLLLTAVKTYDHPHVHQKLGTLYFQWFRTRYERAPTQQLQFVPKSGVARNQLRPIPQNMLENAANHFAKADLSDPETALMLGEVYIYMEADLQAAKVYEDLSGVLEERLRAVENTEARITLAKLYRRLLRFAEADEVLRVGANLSGDPRFDAERCSLYLLQLSNFRKDPRRNLVNEQGMLREAYMADPTEYLMLNEYFLSLCSPLEAESGIARSALQNIVAEKEKTSTALYLLYFDAVHRSSRVDAEKYAAALRKSPDPAIAAAAALVIDNALKKGLPTNSPQAASELYQTAQRIWPEHPDMLFLQGSREFKEGKYAGAVQSFGKVLERRENNGTLQLRLADEWRVHAVLAEAYLKIGRRDKHDEHLAISKAAAQREGATKQKL